MVVGCVSEVARVHFIRVPLAFWASFSSLRALPYLPAFLDDIFHLSQFVEKLKSWFPDMKEGDIFKTNVITCLTAYFSQSVSTFVCDQTH